MTRKRYRILFAGERWLGSDASSALRAFRRLGHFARGIDYTTLVPEMWPGVPLKIARRLIRPLCVHEYNKLLVNSARAMQPHIFIGFKGKFIHPDTVATIRRMGIAAYNYYPDVSAFSHGDDLLAPSLQQYDCVFSTKTFFAKDLAASGYPLRHCEFFPPGYDPEAHHPVEIGPEEEKIYGADATFIGVRTDHKDWMLSELKRLLPDLNLAIWGNLWDQAKAKNLKDSIRGRPVVSVEYMLALCASKIALGLLSEKVKGSSSGDLITARTFNIPATGSFMLHPRTDEIHHYFVEGKEIDCFADPEELAQKVTYYLAHPDERKAIARAGYERCVPAYAQDERVQRILNWHEEFGQKKA